jgi:hypothetical protein
MEGVIEIADIVHGEWSIAGPGQFTPTKELPETTERDARWAPQPVWAHCGRHPSSVPATLNVQAVVESLYERTSPLPLPSPLYKKSDIHDSNNTRISDWSSIPGNIKFIFTITLRLAPGKYV